MSAYVYTDRKGFHWLVDRHPSHKNGRLMRKLGTSDEDKREGEAVAAAKNKERESEAQLAATSLQAGRPIRGEAAFRAYWLAAHGGFSASHAAAASWHFNAHLIPYFGDFDLRELTDAHVKSFAGHLADTPKRRGEGTLGYHSVRNAIGHLRRVLFWLESQRRLAFRLPVRFIVGMGAGVAEQRGARRKKRQAWTRSEASHLLTLAGRRADLYRVCVAALHTGARKGELLALTWADVNLDTAQLSIDKSLTRAGRLKSTKNGKERLVDLSPELRELLRAMARERFADRPFATKPERVFLMRDGEPWNYLTLETTWRRLRDRAHAAHGTRPLQFHCWRHTYASWALQAGEDPAWIAKQLGHDVETLLRHYAHFVPGQRSSHAFLSIPAASAEAPARAG